MQAFDNRLVTLTLQLTTGIVEYSGVNIVASGRKYDTSIPADCEARIYNLTAADRNNILTQASPLKIGQNTPVNMVLSVGRESYGTFILYQGNVLSCDVTQPPDIGVGLRAITLGGAMGLIVQNNQSSIATLKTIAQSIADSLGVGLDFQATNDKQIDNYSFTGAALKQVEKLNHMGGIKAYIDNGTLVVQDANKPRTGDVVQINANTGMVGIPQVTELGVIVKAMINPQIKLGGQVNVTSLINPAANGLYYVTQINFEVANRENPFWYTLSCLSPDKYLGGTL
jgi:hypothetical protein